MCRFPRSPNGMKNRSPVLKRHFVLTHLGGEVTGLESLRSRQKAEREKPQRVRQVADQRIQVNHK